MAKKRGRKVSYITYAGEEVKELIAGKEYGVKLHKSTNNYYSMLPDNTAVSGTKKKWLGSDLGVAVVKFRALVAEIKGEQEQFTETQIEIATEAFSPHDLRKGKIKTNRVKVPVKESEHIEWLKKELQNPRELARKTGIEEFIEFGRIIAKDTNIPLADLPENYVNKKRKISPTEARHAKAFFKEFLEVIECQYVEEVTLKDIHRYEDYLDNATKKDGTPLAPKTIKNRMNKVATIFSYNIGRYKNSDLIQVHKWLEGLERPIEDELFNPNVMSLENFNKLYEASQLKYKLMLLLGLNCGMYPIDITRLEKDNIDFEKGTIAFRRGKTGRVLAVSHLWGRTKKVLAQWMKERKVDSNYIFISYLGVPYKGSNGITNAFNEQIRENAKVSKKVKFNHLRDTFATLGQDLGYTKDQVNLVLGHRTGINDRYAARNASKLTKEICEAVEKEFFKEEKPKATKRKKTSKK